jgi:D-serine deaminase-like pyridoxal phosphate-dependent protein
MLTGRAADLGVLERFLAREASTPLPPGKGWAGPEECTPVQLTGLSPAEAGFSLPLMVLDEAALEHNVRRVAQWCAEAGVLLAPHAKTTMSPYVAAVQLRADAWALTVADLQQARVCAAAGVRRILVANEVVDPAGLRWMAHELTSNPDLDVIVCVDSRAGVEVLDQALRRLERPLPVLVELGFAGGRGGARGIDAARDVAKAVDHSRNLLLVGASCYEGVFGASRSAEQIAAVRRALADLKDLGTELHDGGLLAVDRLPGEKFILSAGGSTYADVVIEELAGHDGADRPWTVLLRAGGLAISDHGFLGEMPHVQALGLRNAAEIWAHVLSRPEPGRAIAGAGKRDLSFDLSLPTVLAASDPGGTPIDCDGIRVTGLNDQHCILELPSDSRLCVGSVIRLAGAHSCTQFDKWRAIPVVDEQNCISAVARTYF